jgi:hypothetical protein
MRSFFLTRYRKHKAVLSRMAMALAAAAGLTAASAEATSVSIINPGFDTTVAGYGAFTGGPSLGWTSVNGGSHTNAAFYLHGSGGSAYINDTGTVTQTLSDTWSVGTYTLTAYGTAYTHIGPSSSYMTASLLNGVTPLDSETTHLNAALNVGLPNTLYEPLTQVVVTILPTDVGIIGQPITIKFSVAADLANTNPGYNAQSYLEDVALEFTPVPEPGSLCLIVTGMAATGIVVRKRRKA